MPITVRASVRAVKKLTCIENVPNRAGEPRENARCGSNHTLGHRRTRLPPIRPFLRQPEGPARRMLDFDNAPANSPRPVTDNPKTSAQQGMDGQRHNDMFATPGRRCIDLLIVLNIFVAILPDHPSRTTVCKNCPMVGLLCASNKFGETGLRISYSRRTS